MKPSPETKRKENKQTLKLFFLLFLLPAQPNVQTLHLKPAPLGGKKNE
jgi:hypothetical protein